MAVCERGVLRAPPHHDRDHTRPSELSYPARIAGCLCRVQADLARQLGRPLDKLWRRCVRAAACDRVVADWSQSARCLRVAGLRDAAAHRGQGRRWRNRRQLRPRQACAAELRRFSQAADQCVSFCRGRNFLEPQRRRHHRHAECRDRLRPQGRDGRACGRRLHDHAAGRQERAVERRILCHPEGEGNSRRPADRTDADQA